MENKNNNKNRSGFVNILGVPNSGKSTLLNRLVGKKVSIVSHKVQTTRFCVKGVSLHPLDENTASQIIFVDTPGIFEAKRRLDKAMVSAAWSELKYADKISKRYNTQHFVKTVSPNDLLDFIPKITDIYDEPQADTTAIPIYFISQLAKQ